MLIGRPLVGMQTFDVLRAFDYLAELPEVDTARISVHGVGHGGVVALYAGALEPRLAAVTAEDSLLSYMHAVRADLHNDLISVVVPGVLRHFDLPDVAAAIAPRPVRIVRPRDASASPVTRTAAEGGYQAAVQRYEKAGRAEAITFVY